MTDKHTPGPWHVVTGAVYTGIDDDHDVPIAYIDREPDNGTRVDERDANANLIAAAPTLLEALEMMTEHASETYPHFECERGQADIATAHAIIKAAKGNA